MPKYQESKMSDLCHLVTDGKHGDCKNEDGSGYYFLSAKDIRNEKLNYENARQITQEDFAQVHKRTQLEPLDILVSNSGTIGRIAIAKHHIATSKTTFQKSVAILKPNRKVVVPHWLYYYLRYAKERLINVAGGTAQKNLLLRDLRAFPIPLPPLPTQRKIAAILSVYDDLIENNNRRIEILEEMARMLYREWFVKFRYPGHESDRFFESELGLIPEGWEVVKLEKFIDIKHGYAFKGKFFSKEPTSDILLTPGNFQVGGGFKGNKLKYYDGNVPPEFILKAGDLLVTMTDLSKLGDTLGYPAFVPYEKGLRFLHNQRLGRVIVNKNQLGLNYLYHIFCSDYYRHHVLASATGTTVKHTAPDRIKSFQLALAPLKVRNAFEETANFFQHKITLLQQKNNNLRQTRDLLLPRLISGEIDVENLDIKIE